MTDDASTAYICIYCPFNSDNLQALENHLASKTIDWKMFLLFFFFHSIQVHMNMDVKMHYQHQISSPRRINAKRLMMKR